mgnify:CR=1 FL=1
MTQIDGGLRPIFRDKLKKGWHWQSVETGGTGLGVPDSNFCKSGVERWVEFKQTDAWACTLRPEQVAWHRRRALCGGRSFIAVRRWHDGGPRKGPPVDELWLFYGEDAMRLKDRGLCAEGVVDLGIWKGGPSRWDWDEIGELLIS